MGRCAKRQPGVGVRLVWCVGVNMWMWESSKYNIAKSSRPVFRFGVYFCKLRNHFLREVKKRIGGQIKKKVDEQDVASRAKMQLGHAMLNRVCVENEI